MVYFLTMLFKVLLLIALALPGFILRKTKLMPDGASAGLCNILIYVSIPFLILDGFQGISYTPEIAMGIVYSAILAFVFHFAMVGVGVIAFRNKFYSADRVARFATVFSNCGFFGYPVLRILYPELPEAMIYAVIYNAVFNLLAYTIGVYLISGNKKDMNIVRAVLSPATIMLALSLPLFFLGISISDISQDISSFVSTLANLATPLAMIVMGIKLADSKPKELLLDKNMYLVGFTKLIVAPVLMGAFCLLLAAFSPMTRTVSVGMIVLAAMPSATTGIAFAESYKADSKSASAYVIGSTVMSIATIPIMALLLAYV